MRSFFLLILLLHSAAVLSQNWVEYRVDENISVQLPEPYVVKDTLMYRIARGEIPDGYIAVVVVPYEGENAGPINNEDELANFYEGSVIGAVRGTNGKVQSKTIMEMGELLVIEWSSVYTFNGIEMTAHCWSALVKEKFYTIQHVTERPGLSGDFEMRERLFSSIAVSPDLGIADQLAYKMTPEHREYTQAGEIVGIYARPIMIGLMVIFLVLFTLLYRMAKKWEHLSISWHAV